LRELVRLIQQIRSTEAVENRKGCPVNVIPYADKSDTFSKVWKLRVISRFRAV
jgi:hypothetical protein